MKSNQPHPKLIPLLEKYNISWDLFCKKGRLPDDLKWVKDKRASIVTEFHSQGTSWADMVLIIGLSQGSIQRLTKAMWNPASRNKLKEIGKKVGKSWKGKKRPGQLEKQWENGDFDFHRGRKRPEWEKEKLRALWTPELRSQRSKKSLAMWRDPVYRKNLLDYHRSPEVRAERSRLQTERMLTDPVRWRTRGRGSYAEALKEKRGVVWTRSSYERRAILVLDKDPEVVSYNFEPRIKLSNDHWIVPDFLVLFKDGSQILLEIKASWVLSLSVDHKIRVRLQKSKKLACDRGWGFSIWTEKDRLKNVKCA